MSDDLTPRDVIARMIEECEPTIASTVPLPYSEVAGFVVAALDAAGWSITKKVDEA